MDQRGGKELADAEGCQGLELILPDWLAAMDAALVLTIDPAYFRLTGASSDGCTAWCATSAGGRKAAAGRSAPLTANQAVSRTSPDFATRPAGAGHAQRRCRLCILEHRADAGDGVELLLVSAVPFDGTG